MPIHIFTAYSYTQTNLSFLWSLSTASSGPRYWRSACSLSNNTGELYLYTDYFLNNRISSMSVLVILYFPVSSPPLTSSWFSHQVKVKASCVVHSSKLTIGVQPPLAVTQDQFVLEPIGQSTAPFRCVHVCLWLCVCVCMSLFVCLCPSYFPPVSLILIQSRWLTGSVQSN